MLKNHLSKLMGEKRYSIVEVSRRTGLTTSTISNLYNDKVKRLDFDTLEKICKLFNCQPNDLFEYIPDETQE
ncbi:helix-turn-helix domain-containing protein [Fusobacterium pseudoperiodonticum]|uniref:Cro/Cl family transcriptional regulator n=1 Tax=Fusobacterium pseudoperiodonticum TaxID=2663009 RepID=A0AAD0F2P0_9FUSO|nr:helix-turn-helix transcriptional regulator [Fusobacterium pseudoperiodonticum]ATV35342.1 Cro/Cl family transcriptional regulator [Fusobacterium pseudoperiodonticum]ATV61763.1 Cro/Cl family transcriptional regulator [Fusobacterium pseudoperiodonticum]DAP55994.1 MAG TPA: Cro/C1-type HTH DNA-binding domain protein [Caudoviricetes sp.]